MDYEMGKTENQLEGVMEIRISLFQQLSGKMLNSFIDVKSFSQIQIER